MNLRVILDIFSGMPNPQWQLEGEQSLAIITLVSGLSATEPGEMPPLPDLGYRGFEITGFVGECDTHRIFGGYVDACGTILRDKGQQIELRLLQTGEPILDPGLYSELLSEMVGK
ncbi:hypothetical protein [Hoeflea sp.]|uniref:hypothetical protein n=1 Tax=Hoeflea sp. TaxID=1940281 RepID=UPI00374A5BD9